MRLGELGKARLRGRECAEIEASGEFLLSALNSDGATSQQPRCARATAMQARPRATGPGLIQIAL